MLLIVSFLSLIAAICCLRAWIKCRNAKKRPTTSELEDIEIQPIYI